MKNILKQGTCRLLTRQRATSDFFLANTEKKINNVVHLYNINYVGRLYIYMIIYKMFLENKLGKQSVSATHILTTI
jgi:hypothetical protein